MLILRNSLFSIMIVPFDVPTSFSLPSGGTSSGSPQHPRSPTYCWVGMGVPAAHVVSTDLGKGDLCLITGGQG